VAALKMASCRTINKNKKRKKVKNQDSMGKTNFFLITLGSFNHMAASRVL
jgi:hypothetical protein